LHTQFELGAVVGSVCTGSVILAESGLFDGEEAKRLFESTAKPTEQIGEAVGYADSASSEVDASGYSRRPQ